MMKKRRGKKGIFLGAAAVFALSFWGCREAESPFEPEPPKPHPYLLEWGKEGSGDGEFYLPYDVALDGSGNVYVVDTYNHRIQKFDGNGVFLLKWGSFGSAAGEFNAPSDVAVDDAGNVYVADRRNNRIQKFSPDGAFLTQFGKSVVQIAFGPSGNLYAVGYEEVLKYDATGAPVTQWGSATVGQEEGKFYGAYGIAVDQQEKVYVGEMFNHRVQKFDENGVFLLKWGIQGEGDGQLNSPFGIFVDKKGTVYVADRENHRIQMFTGDGKFLGKFGTFGYKAGEFYSPYGVAVDAWGNVYVADTGNHRIQKFGP